MLFIPAIDLRGGKVVRLFQGDYEKAKVYGEDPLQYALYFERAGAKRLHIIDLDGAKVGSPCHRELILQIAKALSIPVQTGGGLRTLEDIKAYLEGGVSQVILGTKAIESKDFLENITSLYPHRVIVSVDVRGGKVSVAGWLKTTDLDYLEFLEELNPFPLFAVILTVIERDGTGLGIDLTPLESALKVTKHPLILAGGVSTIEDLKKLKPLEKKGLLGVISGRALYEGTLDLATALSIVEAD